MARLKLILLVLAVTAVAGCGPDDAAPASPGGAEAPTVAPAAGPVAVAELDDEEVARLLFEAAADGDLARVPGTLPGRVSRVRAAVLALHDQLLERRESTPSRDALLGAIERLALATGGADAGRLQPLVEAWKEWSDEEAAVEAELARLLAVGASSLMLPEAPGAEGLSGLAEKAGEKGSPPPMSTAAAGLLFLRYAALALGEDGSDVSAAQRGAMDAATARFIEIGWPGGFAMLAEPVAIHLLRRDLAGVRGTVLWSAAADAYMKSGDPFRSGQMYIERARGTWSARLDPEAAKRAASLAETGRKRIAESGDRGFALFRACYVHAAALQATGHHEQAIEAAEEALSVGDAEGVTPFDASDVGRICAVSNFHLRRYDACIDAAEQALVFLAPGFEAERDGQQVQPAILHEAAGLAHARKQRFAKAIVHFEQVVRVYEAERGKPWAPDELLSDARITLAGAIAESGDVMRARAAIGEIVSSAAQPPRNLARIASIFVEVGLLDDAESIVAQGEAALGAERAPMFGELRGRIAAARGDLAAARTAFEGAITYVTGGDPTRQSPRAALILESWAKVEEEAGDRQVASDLLTRAMQHLVDIGMQSELDRLHAEVKRLRE